MSSSLRLAAKFTPPCQLAQTKISPRVLNLRQFHHQSRSFGSKWRQRSLVSRNLRSSIRRSNRIAMASQFAAGSIFEKSSAADFQGRFFGNSSSKDGAAAKQAKGSPAFKKVLIANRGEIARRIIRSCRDMGIGTVAIYSTLDRHALHVLEADEAVCVGPAPSSSSYLNMDAICDAVVATGANAVHPGYGFLSENAEFARRITEDLGVTFVGPSAWAIDQMGDKIQSKQLARDAGVNVIPGFDGVISSPEEAVDIAENLVGFPVMVKAAAGGGGKGMRICYTPEEVKEGYHLSKAEAQSFFGDDRLFIERYVEHPRHIEMQVLSGRRSQDESSEMDILCFPERECSIQRRNQKVIEESPSTLLSPETLAEMARQVRMLVRSVDYTTAGTVEFLVDAKQNFYFLEMNTRLQVEHPVTEMITGVDLVHGMLEVAAGRGVPAEYVRAQKENVKDGDEEGVVMPHVGHAMEARIYAEDPLRGFLPSTGPLLQYIEPPVGTSPSRSAEQQEESATIRVDSGVTAGVHVTPYYDPMLSKLIAYHPSSRTLASEALADALDRYVIHGIGHNASFASEVLRHEEFLAGNATTNFIPTHYPDGFSGVALTTEEYMELAIIAALIHDQIDAVRGGLALSHRPSFAPSNENDGEEDLPDVVTWLGGMFGAPFGVRILHEGEEGLRRFEVRRLPHQVAETVEHDENAMKEEGDASETSGSLVVEVQCDSIDPTNPVVEVVVDGKRRAIQIGSQDIDGKFSVQMFGASVDVVVMSPMEYEHSLFMLEPKPVDTSDKILSPMPGVLISYAVKEGDKVEVDQEICIVEAMKMQNVIRSPRAGIIEACLPAEGSSLLTDEVIVKFKDEDDSMDEEAV